jgi:hypothetical protein
LGAPLGVPFRTQHRLGAVVNRPSVWCERLIFRTVLVCTLNTDSREADAMRKLTFGMNLSLDGYIAAAPATTSAEACRRRAVPVV